MTGSVHKSGHIATLALAFLLASPAEALDARTTMRDVAAMLGAAHDKDNVGRYLKSWISGFRDAFSVVYVLETLGTGEAGLSFELCVNEESPDDILDTMVTMGIGDQKDAPVTRWLYNHYREKCSSFLAT